MSQKCRDNTKKFGKNLHLFFYTYIFIFQLIILNIMTTYTRKTQDVYFIMGNYGQGWEEVDQFDTRKEAKLMLKEYNLIAGSHKIVCKRVKL